MPNGNEDMRAVRVAKFAAEALKGAARSSGVCLVVGGVSGEAWLRPERRGTRAITRCAKACVPTLHVSSNASTLHVSDRISGGEP
eukprot:6208213-Pleurochrysis_carterae.AAC.2